MKVCGEYTLLLGVQMRVEMSPLHYKSPSGVKAWAAQGRIQLVGKTNSFVLVACFRLDWLGMLSYLDLFSVLMVTKCL